MMRRRALLLLLAAGTVAGYASGFSSLAHHRFGHGHSCQSWREDAESNRWRDAESGPSSWAPPPRPVTAPAAAPAPVQAPPASSTPAPAQPGPG